MAESKPALLPVFQSFADACESRFRVLVEEHGFEHGGIHVAGHECTVVYRKLPNVAVSVMYEAFARPVVMITLRNPETHRGNRSFQVSLDNLMKHRRKEWRAPRYDGKGEQGIAGILDEYVHVLEADLPEIVEAADGVGGAMRRLLGWKRRS